MELNLPRALFTGSRKELILSRERCLSEATDCPWTQGITVHKGNTHSLVKEEASALAGVQKACHISKSTTGQRGEHCNQNWKQKI